MQWDISFDICALVILTVFFAYFFTMKRFKNRLNVIFEVLCISVAITTVFDIFATVTIAYQNVFSNSFIYFANILYLVSINTLLRMFYTYVLVISEKRNSNLLFKILRNIPYAVSLLLILTTPVTGWIIHIDEQGVYQHGFLMIPLHLLACVYVLLGLIAMVSYRQKMSIHRRFSIYLYMVFLLTAIILQGFFPDKLLLGLASTMGVLFLYLGQHNPNETIDDLTELFNQGAFILNCNQYIKEERPFQIIAFSVDDFSLFIEQHGDGKAKLLIKKIAEFIHSVMGSSYAYRLDGYKFAMIIEEGREILSPEVRSKYSYASEVFSGNAKVIQSDDEKILLQAVIERFDHPWHLLEEEIRLSACICCISYPNDVHRMEEIIDIIDASLTCAREIGQGTILYAAEYTETRERHITELMRKQSQLEEMTQEAEAAREAAENADRSKTKFLANMSHEIRTPMNAIMGMTELVLRDDINNQVRRNMSNIQSAGNTLLAIINDILDFSKIEAGKMEVFPSPYYMASMLNNVLSVVSARIVGKTLDFIVDVDPTIPAQLIGDEMRMRQIIINLLGNAVKYTESGTITLRVTWSLIEKKLDDDTTTASICFQIIDTGAGIRPEHLNRLFHSFTRIEEGKNRLVEGTGLGLSICKRLVDLMGGSISVESVYGLGSTFTVKVDQEISNIRSFAFVDDVERLRVLVYAEGKALLSSLLSVLNQFRLTVDVTDTPEQLSDALIGAEYTHVFIEYTRYDSVSHLFHLLKGAKVILALKNRQLLGDLPNTLTIQQPFYCLNVAEVLNDSFSSQIVTENKSEFFVAPEARVLVVDDNIVNLQIITGLMQPHRMQVETAESGKECLALLKQHKYNIIFMDHMMPEMDGVETLHRIRAMEGSYYQDVPVIMITANAVSGVKEMFEQAGFQDFISKPISIERLEETLLKYLPINYIHDVDDTGEDNPGLMVSLIIPGVNVQHGIELCGGKLQNYISLLSVVLLDGRRKAAMLNEYGAKEDFKNYCIEAHALKSVAAGIGAIKLSEFAKEQEFACKEERYDEVRNHYLELCTHYEKLLDNIQVTLDENQAVVVSDTVKNLSALSPKAFYDRLTIILALLHDFEEDIAMTIVNELQEHKLDAEQKKILFELKLKLDLFDYGEAEEYIKAKLASRE